MRSILLTSLTLILASAPAGAQATPNPATTAKVHLAAAKAHAKKWKADAILFQIQARNVTDGKARWEYDFTSPATGSKTCLMVGVDKTGKASSAEDSCDTTNEMEIKDFAIDSDKAAAIALQAGLKNPKLTMGLSKSGSGSTGKLVWLIMEDRGMKSGDQSVDIDAMTGAVSNKSKMP